MKKKILIITYYWPPSGGIGVHRCLKFAKYLKKQGWEVTVYTAENALYPYVDESNLKHVPEGITVIKRKIVEPFAFYKKFTGRKKDEPMSNPVHVRDKKQSWKDRLAIWVRGNFFIPDARSLWIKPSVKFLTNYLKEHPVDVILSDGPPHTNTVIAMRLSQHTGIPWLADFQDPWTQVDYYQLFKITKWADKKHRKLEQEVFRVAKHITIASPTWKKDLESIGAKNVDPIFWGYDEDDFTDLHKQKKPNEFVISHAGLFGFDRKPDNLFKALAELKKENPDFGKRLNIKLAGMIDFSIIEAIEANGLTENFINLGNISRKEALQLTMDSDLLLLPLNKSDNIMGRIPGKLFEQMRSGNPILVLGPKGSDVAHIVESTQSGKSIEYEDYTSIKQFVEEIFARTNSLHQHDISFYSVENQVKILSQYLNEIS